MKSIAVLQARTSSSRLPGKVLLPINGIPIAILAAKRAANTGRPIVIATSQEASDDALSDLIRQHGITCFRGSLENVLGRIVQALSSHEDETIVFRLTADNVFPDGKLLEELEQDFIHRKLDYLHCNGEPSGLPYGMSVEVTRLGHLREAARNAEDKYDREHVTPYIIRKFGDRYFTKYGHLKKGRFRCTIDCLDDYLGIQKVLAPYEDPVGVDFLELAGKLEGACYQPSGFRPANRLVLGTAQIGSHYGIANKTGRPSFDLAQELIKTAIANGVAYLDTARVYGRSEMVIGETLGGGWAGRAAVVTKLSPLSGCPADAPDYAVRALVEASIYQSCSLLRQTTLDVVMLHRASHLNEWNGAAWKKLKELKNEGLIKSLGASVQSPYELGQVLSIPDITFIQLPFNILDWRWDEAIKSIRQERQKRKLTIHVRSALLQGLLVSEEKSDWHTANEQDPEKVIQWLEEQASICNRRDKADLCLSYVYAQDWLDGVVVGMETLGQLHANVEIFNRPSMIPHDMERIAKGRPVLSESTLNPAEWKKASQ